MDYLFFEEQLIRSVKGHALTCIVLFCLVLVFLIANIASYKGGAMIYSWFLL